MMYVTVEHRLKKKFWGNPEWKVEAETFMALPDAVAKMDDILKSSNVSNRELLSKDVPDEDKMTGTPSVILEAHDKNNAAWLIWAPQTSPSKLIFENDNGRVILKSRFSMRTMKKSEERGTVIKNDTICEIYL